MIMLLAFVLFICLLISNRSLSSRISDIEAKLRQGAGAAFGGNAGNKISGEHSAAPGARVPESFVASLKEEPGISSATPLNSNNAYGKAAADKGTSDRFAEWVKEDWLMKLGAFLFIIGFGWFVSYAFANNWIGPVGRISFGIFAGALMMALGFWRMMKYPAQGAVFMALGAGMAMLTIFAGRSIYGFFTPVSAVAFDFIIVAFVSFASYKFNVQTLAFTAQLLAFLAPLLTAGQTDSIFLFSYLFFVSLATLWLAAVTGWRSLITSSLLFVGLYSLPYIASGSYGYGSSLYYNDAPVILNFAYLLSGLYLLAGMFAVAYKGVEDAKNEIMLAVLNGAFLFLWIQNVALEEWRVMIFAAAAVAFAACSFIAFWFSARRDPFYAYGSVAAAFVAAATAAQLSGAALTIAFTVEVLFLVMTVLALTHDTRAAAATSSLFVAPIVLSLGSVAEYAISSELFNEHFFVLLFLSIALIAAGRLITHSARLGEQNPEEAKGTKASPGSMLVVFGIFYLGYILWQFLHILMAGAPDIATMTTLVIYTIAGLVAYFAGLYGNDAARRTYGAALLGFVVVRLILLDVWQMELFGRVITFLAIGILLMSTAFFTKRTKREFVPRITIK